jgi:hypothetical protein
MAEPAGPELREFHKIAVRIADRRYPRLLAEVCGRLAKRDRAAVQPLDRAGQVEDHECQLDRTGATCWVLRVVPGGMEHLRVRKAPPVSLRSLPLARPSHPSMHPEACQ